MEPHNLSFAVSGMYSYDVDPTTISIDTPFADRLREVLASLHFESPIQLIVFHPIIMRADLGRYENHTRYGRTEPAVSISVNIPHAEWTSGTETQRVELYASALRQGITRLKPNKLTQDDQAKFIAAIDQVLQEFLTKFSDA